MASSTSRHASFSPWLLVALFTGIVGAPLLWLTAMQAGYVLAYQACDERSTNWVSIPTLIALATAVLVALVAFTGYRQARRDRLPMPFMGWLAVGISVLMIIVMAASSIAPMMLYPCD